MSQYIASNKQDGYRNVIDENCGPEPMEYIFNQDKCIVEMFAAHSEYLNNKISNEFSPACPTRIEKPKDKDIRIKEPNVKRDYVRYTILSIKKKYTVEPKHWNKSFCGTVLWMLSYSLTRTKEQEHDKYLIFE
ncbi:hypothetical protein PHYBLDRAFT_170898 [Phycomyces blakesleeanus NRRL 1555(-)]|uniref:Uncharacterized protein n=1 Tax=Phycomyces blakesleeanus (strain ATCC 8743b / DSM 1359 / FGSC 10004 / NBRC 33097 / NRRL 1555) TaxID=763407 RepID=A0A162WTA1_PHYB8|nr:hypothetical protein PHYBLDRAFT_170898 [Phycomyces blakesleeanus NRRL 1555(-)]OAD70815.1 hypothetical protein PHYBLDRAFT_170898 [Phycomyces blakesleeanus NRRL 1555(-)]|eukprot:XP_018288855.1 hypothetical protein PHYBLDRAFT_170898 [Phycomyces blakesleeanus NRRL 1555(-)]